MQSSLLPSMQDISDTPMQRRQSRLSNKERMGFVGMRNQDGPDDDESAQPYEVEDDRTAG